MDRLDSRVVPYWIITSLLFVAFLGGLAVAAFSFFVEDLGEYETLAVISLACLLGVLALFSILQPLLSYVFWRYAIGEQLLVARFGILWRSEKSIPISRLQHVDLTRGPVERLFGLATLVVFTAGTEEATFRVPGLAVDRAQGLRDQILATRGDDVI
jgi:hypothetical protein